ncbi:MAG TPA: MobV family relaxase [Flavobacterium sp.]|nr:MobV family relaxase [Flavobacterium sp.]
MSYSIFRVAKVKNAVTTRALQRHNQRENKTYGNQDIDHSRTHLNYDLINPDTALLVKTENGFETQYKSGAINYVEKIEERIQEGYQGTRKIRSDAIKHVDGIITSDKEFFDRLSKSDQEQYFKDSLEFIKKEYGEKNILYATVHLDEKTPHMHFGFVPLTEDGRLSAKDMIGNKKALSELQDRFNDFVNERGYNLDRGEKSVDTKHIEIMKFKEKTLNEKISKLENEAKSLEKNVDKLKDIDQRVVQVDDLERKVKEIPVLKQVVMSKDDFETFKEVAKSGIATLEQKSLLEEQLGDLKTSNSFMIQTLQNEKEIAENERDEAMDESEKLRKKVDELEHENNILKQTLVKLKDFYKDLIKGFSEQIGYFKTKVLSELYPNDKGIPGRYFADEKELEGYKAFKKEKDLQKEKELQKDEDEFEL